MIPVFVPSYKRYRATFLVRSMNYRFPLYLFVRDEDVEGYRWIKGRPNTHLIRLKQVTNIGETRAAMVRYAQRHNIDRIFMLDDDITRLDLTLWDATKEIARASGTMKKVAENLDLVLSTWENLWEDEALLGASYRPYSWSLAEREIQGKTRAQLQQCIGVNIELLVQTGINYRSSAEVGNEDLFLQLECYQHGLKALKTNQIQYDCPAMGSGVGGCNSDNVSIVEKQKQRVELFMRACKNNPRVVVRTTKSGVPSIKFNWKYIEEVNNEPLHE